MKKAMILAAGEGRRLRPLTEKIPKPLVRLGKYCLIEYHLFNFVRAGITEVVINVNYLSEQIIAHLGSGERYGLKIHYSVEKEHLETGGGVFNALPLLGDEPFIVVAGDIFTNFDFVDLPLNIRGDVHLVLTPNPSFHPEGDYVLQKDGYLNLSGKKLNYGGIAVIHPRLFADACAGKFKIAPLFSRAIKNHLATGQYYEGPWFNITTLAEVESAQAWCEKNL